MNILNKQIFFGVNDDKLLQMLLLKSNKVNRSFEEWAIMYEGNFETYQLLSYLNDSIEQTCLLWELIHYCGYQSSSLIKTVKALIKIGHVKLYDGKSATINSDTRIQITQLGIESLASIDFPTFSKLPFEQLNQAEKVMIYNLLAKVNAPFILT